MKIIITESQKQMLIESVDSFVVKEVPNKGKGVIVQTNFKKGDEIGKLISKTPNKIGRKIKRTSHETDVLGRYSNHSSNPNTKYDMRDGEVYLIASRDIDKGEELLINYKKLENLLGVRPGLFFTDDIVD
jgi:SET domain-containing protein